ncbi:MAG: folate family ECF transporter S component [Ruminococcus sp.]|nr:folate family ECF transporter S component [Ruminococcus sp.]
MNCLIAKFRDSAQELSSVKGVSLCAMLLALRVVVGYFANFSLAITPNAKVGFAFLPVAIASMLFGPVCGMIVGGLGDIISFLLAPMGGYFFGWTLNGILVGMLYGLFLYKTDSKILFKLIICEVLINFAVEVPLGSLWLMIQSGKAFWVMAGTRAIKCLISVPIETVLVYFFGKVVLRRILRK